MRFHHCALQYNNEFLSASFLLFDLVTLIVDTDKNSLLCCRAQRENKIKSVQQSLKFMRLKIPRSYKIAVISSP